VFKKLFVFTFLLYFMIFSTSFNVMAQDELSETLESADVGFIMSYPDGWESLEDSVTGYLAVAENDDDLEVGTAFAEHLNDLSGQAVFIVPFPTAELGSFGEEAEDRLVGVAEGFGQNLRARDIEQIDVAGGYDTSLASLEIDETFLILVELIGSEGYSFYIFAGAPSDDADELEENFLAMLNTVETVSPEVNPNETSAAGYDIEDAESIAYGDTVEGEITDDSYVVYSFEGLEGDVVTITMIDTSRNDTLDPMVILLDEDLLEITRNDDSGSDELPDRFDSLIDHYELPSDGTYYIVATRFGEFSGTGEGEFELALEEGGTTVSNANDARTEEIVYDTSDAESIEYGDSVEGEVTSDEPFVVYSFEGSEGDEVTITLIDTSRNGSLDPQIILLDADGNEIMRNDDAGSTADLPDNLDSQISEFELEDDGTYYIVATRFGEEFGGSEGDFELTLDEG
jgi:hypothetical protein